MCYLQVNASLSYIWGFNFITHFGSLNIMKQIIIFKLPKVSIYSHTLLLLSVLATETMPFSLHMAT